MVFGDAISPEARQKGLATGKEHVIFEHSFDLESTCKN